MGRRRTRCARPAAYKGELVLSPTELRAVSHESNRVCEEVDAGDLGEV